MTGNKCIGSQGESEGRKNRMGSKHSTRFFPAERFRFVTESKKSSHLCRREHNGREHKEEIAAAFLFKKKF